MTTQARAGGSQATGDESPTSGSMSYLVRVCLVATLGGLLFGYDTAVISGAIGFLKQYFSLTPALVGWAASSALAGCVVGAALAGTVSDRFGRKKVLIVSAILFIISAIGTALPRSLVAFVVFRFVGGVGVGAASMTSPLYIAELSPARIRGRMVSLNQFAIIFGMLVIYFVNYFIAGYGAQLNERRAADIATAFGMAQLEARIARQLGVDMVSIQRGSGEERRSSLVIGKYISRRALLKYEQALEEWGSFFINLEYFLTQQVKVETLIGRQSQSALEVNWTKEY